MTTLIDVSRCPLRCHDRGTCFSWPPEPEFPPICACNELWEGKTCEHRQHNPFNVRRDRVANTQWRAMYGVACTSNETAAACNECGGCGAGGECELLRNNCTLRVDKVVPYRPRRYSSLYGKTRGRGRGRDASPGAKGRGTLAKGLGPPAKGRGAGGRQLRREIWQLERAQGLTPTKLGRAVATAHKEPRHGARRLEAVGAAPPKVGVCLSGWLGVAVHEGGESLQCSLWKSSLVPQLTPLTSCARLSMLLAALRTRDERLSRAGPTAGCGEAVGPGPSRGFCGLPHPGGGTCSSRCAPSCCSR